MKQVKFNLYNGGAYATNEKVLFKNGRNKKMNLPVMWGLIEHPDQGYILFDTGYTRDLFLQEKAITQKIFDWFAPVILPKEEEVVEVLKHRGIALEEIKHVIISHFHIDHVCGLKHFTEATFYCSNSALREIKFLPKNIALMKGVNIDLLPHNFYKRTKLIEKISTKSNDAIFGKVYDMFNDGSISVYHLPGHARGQIGISFSTNKNNYFLIADAMLTRETYLNDKHANPLIVLFYDSWIKYTKTINKIKRFVINNPNTVIVPSHCTIAAEELLAEKEL